MSWLEARFRLPASRLPEAESILDTLGALSVTLEDAGNQPLLEPGPGETPLWNDLTVVALFTADCDSETLQQTLASRFPLQDWRTERVADQDWERSWMDRFEPIRCGERLWICPSWLTPPEPQAINLMLDPGLAFGSGTHPTTALCLRWLDAHPPVHETVVDYGCGSGILAIAALLLGAARVYGVDIDPQALTASRDNAEKNGIDARHLLLSFPDAVPAITADVVLANILAGMLIEKAALLTSLVKPGGWLVLSGILDEQSDLVMAAYRDQFHFEPAQKQEEWVLLAAQKL